MKVPQQQKRGRTRALCRGAVTFAAWGHGPSTFLPLTFWVTCRPCTGGRWDPSPPDHIQLAPFSALLWFSLRRLKKTAAYIRDISSKPAMSSETKFSLCLKYHFCFHASFLSCKNPHSLHSVTHIHFTDCLSDYVWLYPGGKCRAWHMLCVFK